MKNRQNFLKFFFRPKLLELIIILLLLFNVLAIAQETPATGEFPVGATIGYGDRANLPLHQFYDSTGMNLIEQDIPESPVSYLTNYNVQAINMDSSADYIYHYSTSYYSKWQAEEDQDTPYVGLKHNFGMKADWGNASCWSTIGVIAPTCSLMYGPHYHQEKWYRRWLYKDTINMKGIYDVRYIPRWRMALDTTNSNLDPDENVCRLSVWVRHAPLIYNSGNGQWEWDSTVYDHRLKVSDTLKVSDFLANGQFDYFYLGEDTTWYRYPNSYQNPGNLFDKLKNPPEIPDTDTIWTDINGNNGVEFRVEWLRSDAKCTLYVDYVEVYDDYGWKNYIEDPGIVAGLITTYAQSFSGWDNINYWTGCDEPYTIDSYIPLRTVDSLLRDMGAPPLLVHFYPQWNVKINEDSQLVRYYRTAKPDPLNIHFFPFNSWNIPSSYGDWEAFRTQLQISYSLTKEKGFWYKVQNFGFQTLDGSSWLGYRQPEASEQKAEVMLALAHGVKALLLTQFESYPNCDPFTGECYNSLGLIQLPPHYQFIKKDTLWYVFKDEIIPRLKGTLGNTLLDLDYTGDYINLYCNGCPNHDTPSIDYLTIDCEASNYFWHAGFFTQKDYPDNKYFLLTNLKTLNSVTTKLIVSNNTDYKNVCFTDIEGGVDTTIGFEESITYYENMPAGEGRLYRVSTVVLYGGRLIYDEAVGGNQTLFDDMIIENGKTLTVYDTYFANGNIIVKDGSIINGENGMIQFAYGKKLIIKGPARISGTEENKLVLDFVSAENQNGIVIDSLGALTLSYCEIKNAQTGVLAKVYSKSFDIQNCDFLDCEDESINILGQTPYPFGSSQKIKYCTIENSGYGIKAANLSEILIQQNTITNTDLGVFLSNVTNAQVISNQIHTNTEELEGILASSCDGVIRGNGISGHTVGIRLANSTPDVGGNGITGCLYHAMYVGTGSNPNMRGVLVQDITQHSWYAVSGYNDFENNGGYDGGPSDNDGSEIYFYQSNAIMRDGCNSVVDDRVPQGELRNTLLLMNCPGGGLPITIRAENNYWGETNITSSRFGNLNVYYNPYKIDPCPIPQGDDELKLITKTSSGEVIDTLYPVRIDSSSLSDIELMYAYADKLFFTGEVESSENYYDQIIAIDTSLSAKKEAYTKKYEIGKLLNRNAEYFQGLRNTYSSLSESTSDSLIKKIFDQLSSLCLIAKEEIIPAISEFDAIVQQNPNTEEAVYAEIDALTAALLVEGGDSTFQKGMLGKYLVKSSGDYNSKLDELLRKHFGRNASETEEEILPTEYTLYQNYPNPFNPTTIIKYDLPNTSDVSLTIYDILGRKVKELVNTKQQAGRYEIQFNAFTLASGVYIYQLIAEKYINSKKMILLK